MTPIAQGEEKERAKGFEPSTSALGRLHSTTELRPHHEPVYLSGREGRGKSKRRWDQRPMRRIRRFRYLSLRDSPNRAHLATQETFHVHRCIRASEAVDDCFGVLR